MRPSEPGDPDYIEPWDAPGLRGRAGSGLGCMVILSIAAIPIAIAAIWLIGGTIGWVLAAATAFVGLIFVVGAIWQIREM